VWGSYCRGTDPSSYTGYPRGLRSLRPGFKSQHGRYATRSDYHSVRFIISELASAMGAVSFM
jgi:hypothetical protein